MNESTESTESTDDKDSNAKASAQQETASSAGDEAKAMSSSGNVKAIPDRADARPAARRPAAVAALFIALVSLGLSTWLTLQVQPWRASDDDPRIETLQSRIGILEGELDGLQRNLAAAVEPERVSDLERRVEQIADGLEQSDPAVAALMQRIERAEAGATMELEGIRERLAETERRAAQGIARLEQQLGALDRASDGSSDREAERQALLRLHHLLGAARDRLELLGDVAGARRVWAAAIERLEVQDDPDTEGLEQRLRAELDAMSAVSGIDRVESSGALLRAARTLHDWPLKGSGEAAIAETDASATGWRARLGDVLDRMVRVERVESDLLDPAELDLVRDRLSFVLETVALALARGEHELTARLAGEAEARIRSLFDIDAPAVADVVRRLDRLAAWAPAETTIPSTAASEAELTRLIEALQ